MAVDGSDLITIKADGVTVDLLVWRRYRIRAPGITEMTMDLNPHLARIHRTTPFLPVGTQVRIPLDSDILKGAPRSKKVIQLYGIT
jgi:phage tail protein X